MLGDGRVDADRVDVDVCQTVRLISNKNPCFLDMTLLGRCAEEMTLTVGQRMEIFFEAVRHESQAILCGTEQLQACCIHRIRFTGSGRREN
jgi:hypothetical protein